MRKVSESERKYEKVRKVREGMRMFEKSERK